MDNPVIRSSWLAWFGVFVGLPFLMAILGGVLHLLGMQRIGRFCVLGGVGGYVGTGTATFTGIALLLFTYLCHWWRFPEKGASVPTPLYIVSLSVFIVLPIIGLVLGGVCGFVAARRGLTNRWSQPPARREVHM